MKGFPVIRKVMESGDSQVALSFFFLQSIKFTMEDFFRRISLARILFFSREKV